MKRAVIYARLSVTAEESVSIERQLEACRKYADARGWTVVHVATDDGVSATKARPEARVGWREVLDLPTPFEAVIVWKVDRLARRVLDFLHADGDLQDRGAALVAVEDPIDMSTAQGRAFATMLAVFGEMEAAAISARVTSATRHLKRSGRVAGGERPWAYDLARNPAGPGFVLAPIPERAEAVQEAARDLIEGTTSVRAIARRWDALGLAPKSGGTWSPSSVANLLRNPTLYGATIYRGRPMRDETGSVRIGPHAILDRPTWEALQRALAGLSRPRQDRDQALLQGIVSCASCDALLGSWRPSTRSSSGWRYRCQNRECPRPVQISLGLLDDFVEDRFLRSFGHLEALGRTTRHGGPDPLALAAIEADLLDVEDALQTTDDETEALALLRRRKALRADLARLQDSPLTEETVLAPLGLSTREAWERWDTSEKRAAMLSAVGDLTVSPGTPGKRGLDTERIRLLWSV